MPISQEQAASEHITHPGPPIHNTPTFLSIFSTPQLSTSPFLPSLLTTINKAFKLSYDTKPELGIPSQHDRLETIEEFLLNLSDPEPFILIIHFPGSFEVIATASARRYHGPDTTGIVTKDTPWLRKLPVQEGCEEWDLKLMVTAPEAQGRGLAGFMMRTVEAEIRRRYAQKGEEKAKKLRIVLCTPRELTGEFYLKKGFTKDYETWRGEGFNFHILHLSKDIAEK